MAVDPKTNVRKIVTLPRPMAARIHRYRHERELATEAEAIRRLLSDALDRADSRRPGQSKPTST